jgi:hypothetical protein
MDSVLVDLVVVKVMKVVVKVMKVVVKEVSSATPLVGRTRHRMSMGNRIHLCTRNAMNRNSSLHTHFAMLTRR